MKITKTQLKQIIREELTEVHAFGKMGAPLPPGVSQEDVVWDNETRSWVRKSGGPGMEVSTSMPNMKEWWNEDPKDVMSFVYWLKGQIPPAGEDWAMAWESLAQQLEKRHPSPGSMSTSVDLAQDIE